MQLIISMDTGARTRDQRRSFGQITSEPMHCTILPPGEIAAQPGVQRPCWCSGWFCSSGCGEARRRCPDDQQPDRVASGASGGVRRPLADRRCVRAAHDTGYGQRNGCGHPGAEVLEPFFTTKAPAVTAGCRRTVASATVYVRATRHHRSDGTDQSETTWEPNFGSQVVSSHGQGGIRTHGTVSGTPVFETGSFNRSDTRPTQTTHRLNLVV